MKLLSLFIFLATFLFAQGRPVDFSSVLVGVDGKPLMGADGKSSMTLSDAAVLALETVLDEDRTATGAEKFRFDELARKIYRAKNVVLPVEELALIKQRIGKVFGPAVVGPVWRLLDPALVAK
jgi:hypothetical protein